MKRKIALGVVGLLVAAYIVLAWRVAPAPAHPYFTGWNGRWSWPIKAANGSIPATRSGDARIGRVGRGRAGNGHPRQQ
ncbi:MAG: hypothetical protein IPJ94_26755 [Chloroflexi bacterium]|nr:hypothetical protein [Chloroflexota bacterium]